jgi:hypothetical protein
MRQTAVRRLPFSVACLVSLAMADGSVALMIAAIRSTTLSLDSLGIVSSLPIGYYVGMLGLLVAGAVAMTDRKRGVWLLLGYAFVFAYVIWLTPLVVEGTARFRTSYTNLGYVDPILRGDGLVPGHFLYHNWPLFPLSMAALIELTHEPSLTVLAWYPIGMVLAYAGAVVGLVAILGRRFYPRASLLIGCAVAAWSYFVFNWTGQEYFSPQALAYLMFLILLCVLAWAAVERDGELTPRLTVAVLVLFTLIVATHVLTSMMALGVLAALLATRHLHRPTILLTCGLIFIAWQVTIAAPFFVFYGQHLLTSILGAGDFFGSNLESRVRGDTGHLIVTELRIFATAVPFGLAGLVVLLYLRRSPDLRATLRRHRLPNLPRAVSFPIAVIAGTFLVAPVSVYGGEMLIRVLFFTLPALSALIAFGMHQRWFRGLMLATLIVMAPLHLLTHYGNEMLDYVSPGEIAGFNYLSNLAPANVYGGFPAASTFNTIRLDARNAYLFRNLQPATLADYANPMLHHDWVHQDWPLYVAVSRGDEADMTLFQNRPGFIPEVRAFLDQDPDYVKVFSNEDIAIYLWKASATAKPSPSDSEASGAYAESKAAPPLILALLCVLAILLAVCVEVAASLSRRQRARAFAARMMIPSVLFSLVVIGLSGYRVAELIGYIP